MSAAAHLGGPLGCFGLALLLVARDRRLRAAGLAAWAVGALLLALYLAPHGHRAVLAAAALMGVLLALAGAVILRRQPWLLAFATLLLVPARIPVTVGSTDANLLVPLYAVVGAAAVELAWALWRGDRRSRELGVVALPLAAFVAWTGLSLTWAVDLKEGAVELLFFYLPFGLLALCLARLPWEPRRLPALFLQLAAMGLVFAVVGIYQEGVRHVFWNPKVIVGNAYASFFRVNSLFWDPSIYGRFLVVAILACLVVALCTSEGRTAALAAIAIAVMWVGLLFSYSQTSFVTLAVGVVVAAALTWRLRAGAAAPVAAACLAALVLVALPGPARAFPARPALVADTTSGRGKLITEGIRIAVHHPLGGVGVGGFKRAYADRVGLPGKEPKRAASHTTPVTVAAEEGMVGFALFVWVVVATLLLAFGRNGRPRYEEAALVLGLTLLAIGVHSLGYNSLFEDPMTWGALGLAACLAGARAPRRESV